MDLLAGYGRAPSKAVVAEEPATTVSPPPAEKKRKIALPRGPLTPEQIHFELEKRLAPERPQSECDPDMLRKITAAGGGGEQWTFLWLIFSPVSCSECRSERGGEAQGPHCFQESGDYGPARQVCSD
jgi:hypothetical protein